MTREESASPPTDQPGENSTYEIFITVLAYISLTGLVLFYTPISSEVRRIIVAIDSGVCLIFFVDFLRSLQRASSKWAYLKWGWLDLVGSIPGVLLLRVARIPRIVRATRILRAQGYRGILRRFLGNRAESTFLATALGAIVLLGFASMLVVAAERRAPEANITTSSDAIWWAFVTITTVGYGDRFPVTIIGRILAALLMTAGVGLFGVFTSYLATTFLAANRRQEEDIATIKAELAEIKALLQEGDERSPELVHNNE